MRDARLSPGAVLLAVDGRPEGERGGLGEALRGWSTTVRASSTEAALALADRQRPAVAIVHAGLDERPERRPGGVILAAELVRRLPGLSLLVAGAACDLAGWSLLHEMGATARFLPDSAAAEDGERLLRLLVDEVAAREGLAASLRPVALADSRKLESLSLQGFAADVERRLIGTAAQQSASTGDAARLLGLPAGGMRARLRKLGMRLGARSRARSTRERVLVVGAGPASRAFASALAEGDHAVLLLPPGELHAGAEARGGARAAVIEVDGVDGAVDAWALRRVAPAIPIVLHGRGTAEVRPLLRTLGGLSEVLSSDALASSLGCVVERLFALGRASCAADALCRAHGGAGQGPSAAQAVDLRGVICALEDSLKDLALAQEPSRAKAAELLHITVRSLYRRRKASRPPRRQE